MEIEYKKVKKVQKNLQKKKNLTIIISSLKTKNKKFNETKEIISRVYHKKITSFNGMSSCRS